MMRHLSDAWARRGEPNVLLVHYDDLSADLEGQMRWLAGQLGIAVPQQAWPALVRAATFESMRDSADTLVPDRPGSSRATPHSSAGAPQAQDARSSATKSLPPTTPGPPSWHHPTCSPGSTPLTRAHECITIYCRSTRVRS